MNKHALQNVCKHSVIVVAFLKRPLQRVHVRWGFRVDVQKVAIPFSITGAEGSTVIDSVGGGSAVVDIACCGGCN